jgi:hypothetical protein
MKKLRLRNIAAIPAKTANVVNMQLSVIKACVVLKKSLCKKVFKIQSNLIVKSIQTWHYLTLG